MAAEWWEEEAFWRELDEFIFSPAKLAEGAEIAAGIIALLGLEQGASVLDLGCGPGRVAVPLARRGMRVVGVDYQRSYLERAQALAESEGVTLDLRQEDFSDLRDDGEFDAVISVFNSLGYFADARRDDGVLRGAWRALKGRGRFLAEVAHRDGVVRALRTRDERGRDGRVYRDEPRFDCVTGVVESRLTVESGKEVRTFTSRAQTYTATELSSRVRGAGFGGVTVHGSTRGGPPSIDDYTVVIVASR